MAHLVFLLDVDNTLLDNDRLKNDLADQVQSAAGSDVAESFWAAYEEVRRTEGYVDFPETLTRLAAAFPAARVQTVDRIVMTVPFRDYLYTGALDALGYLRSIGEPVIVSDGDHVFQPMKIEKSGLAAAVEGRVLITVRKQAEMATVFERYPADHYAMIDDKTLILSDIAESYPAITTVLVCQGKYARLRAPKHPDLVVPHIADVRHIPRREFFEVERRPLPAA